MRNMFLRLLVAFSLIVTSSFLGGCTIGKQSKTDKIDKKAQSIKSIIDTYYLDEVDESKLEDGVYKGLVEGLEDPYSVYYTAEEYKKLQEDTEGSYVGIGVSVRQDKATGYLLVVKSFENGPAYKAGIKDGDYILEVESKTVKGRDPDLVVKEIRGEEGSKVNIKFRQTSTGKTLTEDIERHSVDVPTVECQILEDGIGYIRISQFDKVTPEQFEEAKKKMDDQGANGVIIDLRGNPGGVLGSVVTMLENMLPAGTICYTEDKNGEGETYTSDGKHAYIKPMVVLCDGNSASAAEIFIGAVKDYKMATIVGTTTFGKGIVQQLFNLGDGSAVKITTSKYYTPNGVCIHGDGIKPDIELEYDESDMGDTYDIKKDNQVNKGIEVLKEKLK